MKKIVLILFFTFLMSDTIFYLENGEVHTIKNVTIKDQNANYIKYSNWEGVKAIDTNKVTSIINGNGDEILFNTTNVIQGASEISYSDKDVVYLKNGSIIKGIIIEQIPNESLKIQTADGSLFVFEFDKISKISKEIKAQKSDNAESHSVKALDGFAYDNLIGGLYFSGSKNDIFALNFSSRLENDLNLGVYFTSYYLDSNLPGQVTQILPYFAWDLTNSKKVATQVIMGGKYTIREWESNYANGSLNHFGLVYGLGINVKIFKNIGFGFVAAMAEDFYFVGYSDGTSEITSEEWAFAPVLTFNFYDVFSK